jgi:hypothetical protein
VLVTGDATELAYQARIDEIGLISDCLRVAGYRYVGRSGQT